MTENHSMAKEVGKDLATGAGHLLSRAAAAVVGLILMIVGIAMGVTIVMLPIGVPLGLFGLAVFLWGFFGRWPE